MQKIIFIVILFLSHNLLFSSIDQIIKEYPELNEFLNSTEFKSQIVGFDIEIVQGSFQQENFASVSIQIGWPEGFTKKIVLNESCINRNVISPEEFKFMLCHELGHLYDLRNNHLFLKNIVPSVSFTLFQIGLGVSIIKSLIKKQSYLAFKKATIGFGLSFISYLLIKKWARDGEFFADEYGVRLAKDKKAAVAMLEKRKLLSKRVPFKFEFLNRLRDLFANHPSEEIRINNIYQLIS